ncbi:MAG: hypothetical protein AAGB11_12695 [Pseudomonadota bacterium]
MRLCPVLAAAAGLATLLTLSGNAADAADVKTSGVFQPLGSLPLANEKIGVGSGDFSVGRLELSLGDTAMISNDEGDVGVLFIEIGVAIINGEERYAGQLIEMTDAGTYDVSAPDGAVIIVADVAGVTDGSHD